MTEMPRQRQTIGRRVLLCIFSCLRNYGYN